MRIILAAVAVLLVQGAPAAWAQDCRGISDSLLRLRCFDDAGSNAVKQSKPEDPAGAAQFGSYPAITYSGSVRFPNFAGRDRAYSGYRTRIRDGMRSGANFAGNQALIEIGCGTGCRSVYSIDVQTGKVSSFPLGGEDYQMLDLTFRKDSKLVVAQWGNYVTDSCQQARFLWTGADFQKVSERRLGPKEVCWQPFKG